MRQGVEMAADIEILRQKIATAKSALERRKAALLSKDAPAATVGRIERYEREHERLERSAANLHPGIGKAIVDELQHDIEVLIKSLDSPMAAPPSHR